MSLQDRPVCFKCHEQIHNDWVFEAPCGHEEHPSAAFHGICLMAWREHREAQAQGFREFLKHMKEEHGVDVAGLLGMIDVGEILGEDE